MASDHALWITIILAGAGSWFFRALPLLFVKTKLINETNPYLEIVNYCSLAVLGSLIYSAAFNNTGVFEFISQFDKLAFLKMSIILVAFCLSCWTRNAVKVFFTCFLVYATFLFWNLMG